jgi:hypothetical protein
VVSYSPGSIRSFVVTTYLDTSAREYLSMMEKSEGQLSLKVRVREYMPMTEANGEPERLLPASTCFLERKERVGELRVKQRVELAKADVGRICAASRSCPVNARWSPPCAPSSILATSSRCW